MTQKVQWIQTSICRRIKFSESIRFRPGVKTGKKNQMKNLLAKIKHSFLYSSQLELVLEQNAHFCRILAFHRVEDCWQSEVMFTGDLAVCAEWIEQQNLEHEGLYVYRNDSPCLLIPVCSETDLQLENLVPSFLMSGAEHSIGMKEFELDGTRGVSKVNLLYRSHDVFDFEYPRPLSSIKGLIPCPVAFLLAFQLPNSYSNALVVIQEENLTDIYVWSNEEFVAYYQVPDTNQGDFASDVYHLLHYHLAHSMENFQPEVIFFAGGDSQKLSSSFPDVEVFPVQQAFAKELKAMSPAKTGDIRATLCLWASWKMPESDFLLSSPGSVLAKNQKLTQTSLSLRKLTSALSVGLLSIVIVLFSAHFGMGFYYQAEIDKRQQEIALNREISDLNARIVQEHAEANQLLKQKSYDTRILNSMVKALPENCEIIQWQKKSGIHFVTGITMNESAIFQLVKQLKSDNVVQKIKITGTEVVNFEETRGKYAKPQLLRFTLRFSP